MSIELATTIADIWRWDSPREKKKDRATVIIGKETGAVSVESSTPIDSEQEEVISQRLEKESLTAKRKNHISKMRFSDQDRYRAKTDRDVIEFIPDAHFDDDKRRQFFDGVRQIAAPLRRRLLMEFRGPGQRINRHQRRGRVDQRSLHKVITGSRNVFEGMVKDTVIDRTVTLMVDCSGSMLSCGVTAGKSQLWTAAQAACACSMVLDLIGVENEVLGWTTVGQGERHDDYDRTTPLRHLIVKPSEQSFQRSRRNFINLALYEWPSHNIDGEALLWGAKSLAQRARRADKKPVLIVFSDGSPLCVPESGGLLASHLTRTVKRVEKAGIKTIGIGIETDEVKQYYPRWAVINNISDLIGSFYEILRHELRSSKKVV